MRRSLGHTTCRYRGADTVSEFGAWASTQTLERGFSALVANSESTNNKRIVIVEDEEDIAYMEAEILGRDRVTTITEGFNNLHTFDWQHYDVAIIDLMLPGLHGTDILRYLQEEHPTIKRVVVSAAPVSIMRDALTLADVVLSKPFLPQQLRAVVD